MILSSALFEHASFLQRFTFSGTEKISVDVVSATAEIQLHAKDLYVSAATFAPEGDGASADAIEINMHLKDTVLTLRFAEALPVGKGVMLLMRCMPPHLGIHSTRWFGRRTQVY